MALIQPPLIKYNLKDRGRTFTGQNRDFDIPAIVRAINSNACQERIKKRDMLGFLGHWVRIRFGLQPVEGGIENGKIKAIEPAIVTTHLKAYPNGDIEHQTEFLDNPSGQIASRMFQNNVGGFSTVIDEIKNVFWGFDWVNEPNYSTNRGYVATMDSVNNGEITLEDILAGEHFERMQAVNMLLEASEAREQLALDSAHALVVENEDLLNLLADIKESTRPDKLNRSLNAHTERFKRESVVFDSVHDLPFFKEETGNNRKEYKPEHDDDYQQALKGLNINV